MCQPLPRGQPLPIIILATGLGQLVCTIWSAALGESAVASVFAIFGDFWLSYAALLWGVGSRLVGGGPGRFVHTAAW
jgi:succinate-acetate transporter protein